MRNTPTCVGKTSDLEGMELAMQKHPHMRGEDSFRLEVRKKASETPPHAWGRQLIDGTLSLKDGNTPTCVGKTLNDH